MKKILLLGLLGVGLMAAPAAQAAPVRFRVGIGFGPAYVGPAPVCPYGYYSYYPYACAPYGFYGPQWFSGGVFIGAGPWFHGFYGRSGYAYRGPGYYGHPAYNARPGFGGAVARGPGYAGRAPAAGYHGGYARNFHGDGHR
jgi:hypothetical protein